MTTRTTPWTPARVGVVHGGGAPWPSPAAPARRARPSSRSQATGSGAARGAGGRPAGRGRASYSLSDPAPQDPALRGGIDMHAHQDPDSNGPSYGQAARSDDAMDLYTRAKAAGMRGFVIKEHLDQSAGLAYYMRKLHPDMEILRRHRVELHHGSEGQPLVDHPHGRDEGRLGPHRVDAELGLREQLARVGTT